MLIQMYINWIKYVKETVPNDQLLIFNAKDGVEKIAEFLGRKTPNWKLPHMNGEIFSRRGFPPPDHLQPGNLASRTGPIPDIHAGLRSTS